MKTKFRSKSISIFTTLAVVATLTIASVARAEIAILAIGSTRVVLNIDGKRAALKINEATDDGIKLLAIEDGQAKLDVNGKIEWVESGVVVQPYVSAPRAGDSESENNGSKVVAYAGPDGFYHLNGKINGRSVRFLVDTGANTIAISSRLADSIGVDYSKGVKGVAQTASGLTPMVGLRLKKVSVGSITLRNVDAGVLIGNFPVEPLLGASFLNQLDMRRDGRKMELQKN